MGTDDKKMPYTQWPRGTTKRLSDAGLTGVYVGVLTELLTYWNTSADNLIYPSCETIMEHTGYSERTVRRAFKEIRKTGLLVHSGGGDGRGMPNNWRVSKKLMAILGVR